MMKHLDHAMRASGRSSRIVLPMCFLAPLTTACAQQLSAAGSLPDAPDVVQRNAQKQDQQDALTLKGTPKRIVLDELNVVRAPAHLRKEDLKWLLPLAGATAASLATDTHTMRHVVSHDPDFTNASGTASDGLRDTAIGVPALLFLIGSTTRNEHERESGLLAGEAVIDAYVADEAIKYVTLRERPSLNNERGHFFSGDSASDPSFVSGHAMVAWSSAAVLAAEYNKPWQQAGIYTLASGVSLTRVLAQQHFPTDALLGSATGWLIGHYVYKAHHRHR